MQKLKSPTKLTETTAVRTQLGQEQKYVRGLLTSAILFRSVSQTWASLHSQKQTHRSWLDMTETCGGASLVLSRPGFRALQSHQLVPSVTVLVLPISVESKP